MTNKDPHLAENFRAAMRRLASTVALITTGGEGGWNGMAVTAVMSVCTEPPTLVIAVNRSASIHPMLQTGGSYCVNLLGERHERLVGAFSGARKGQERFEQGAWEPGIDGLPILSDALASFLCRISSMVEVGTHSMIFGVVEHIRYHPDVDPLLWADGAPAALRRLAI